MVKSTVIEYPVLVGTHGDKVQLLAQDIPTILPCVSKQNSKECTGTGEQGYHITDSECRDKAEEQLKNDNHEVITRNGEQCSVTP